jgi:hypothetical protein
VYTHAGYGLIALQLASFEERVTDAIAGLGVAAPLGMVSV